ncbi:MAG: 50S ribosomal protein L3 [Patescibacteria group bacterium]
MATVQGKKIGMTQFFREDEAVPVTLIEADFGEELEIKEGDKVKVRGISKGKGFQGVVKRHGFSGLPGSHGHKGMERAPGSIGQRFPQHTLKGMRMAGHMGAANITVRNLEVVKIDKEIKVIALKGAVPGRRGTMLEISNYANKLI